MTVDDRDNDPGKESSSSASDQEIADALQSRTDEPLPPAAEAIAERDAESKHPVTPQGRRRRFLNQRNLIIATIAAAVGIVALILLVFLSYRLGYVDRYVAAQLKETFAKYGIRAEIKEFHTTFPPQTVEMIGLELYDAQSGEKLGKIDRLLATVRIEDLYALNLQRNINLKDLKVEGLEAWVTFDAQGQSNFRNIRIPQPEPNRRILFAYSTAQVEIKNGIIHYGDARHEISGDARNLNATVQPDDPAAPEASWMNTVTLSASNSSFTYDGRPINNIEVQARGRVNQTRAEIQELVLRSPVAEARLAGSMDDWRALRYQMNITSSVDLTQLSDVLQSGATLRGTGDFAGVVSGEGDRYKVEGVIKSDALAADGIRLQGLNMTAKGSGQGKAYDINGKAVAELLTAGDFQLNHVQLVGGVMGTGSDFRWIGELRAAAERSYGTTITGLILQDARAEMDDGVLTAAARQFSAGSLSSSGTKANGITASDLRLRRDDNGTTASVGKLKAGTISSSGTKVGGVTANKIDIVERDGVTSVVVKDVQIGATKASGAEIGSLSIAGVRLSVRAGRVEGSTADINAGNVKLADGQVENVKLAKPVFVVEPSGRYRASADLTIGGGMMGQLAMGQASAKLVATSSEIQLNNFEADIFKGKAQGNARLAIARGGTSHINGAFSDLEVSGPLTAIAGAAVPLAGKANGTIDLAFPGTDFKQASGTLTTTFTADVPEAGSGRVPLSGVVALKANRGLFVIDQVNLQTTHTKLQATGQFSFAGDSDLQVDLTSAEAAELQAVLISSGLLPDAEEQMRSYGIELGGQLAFNGTLKGKLNSPDIDGKVSLGSLLVNGNDLGSLSASLRMTADELRIADGRLTEKDGGGMQFTLAAPRSGENNITLEATLDRVNAGNLIAALPLSKTTRAQLGDTQADASGQIKISGIPNAMTGTAELRFGAGRLGGEPLESLVGRASFSGSKVTIETVDARLAAGHIVANGTYDTTTKAFELQGRAEGVQASRLFALANQQGTTVTGTADFNARVSGNLSEGDFSNYQITFDGVGKDVTINGREAGTLSLAGRTENKQLNVTFTTGLLGAPQVIAAQVNLGSERLAANVETTLNKADLSTVLKMILPDAEVKLSGTATGTLKMSGNLLDEDGYFAAGGLQGTVELSELSFRVEDVQLNATSPFVMRFSPTEVTFDKTQFTGPGTNIVLGGTLAIAPGGRQSMTADGQLNLRVLNGLSPDAFTSGIAEVAVRITGSSEAPRLNGTASVANGMLSLLIGNERWSIQNLKALVRFTSNQAQIDQLEGTLGGGRIYATGGALIRGFTLGRFLFNIHGVDVTAPFPQGFRTTGNIDLEIKGTSREQLVGGVVTIRRAEYTDDIELADLINFRREESIEEGSEIELTRGTLYSGLRIEGRNALVVRNNLADLVGSVSLEVNGPVKDSVVSGRITATSGTLNFRNDRYDIKRALMDLPPQPNADPIINIQAESQIRGYRVTVGLAGPLSQPQAIISSEPALPQADVVSLITTGQLSSGDTSASVLSQTGLGTATSLLTDALINAPAQRATSRLFGLSRFEINPVINGRSGSAPTARLTVGKRISKDLSVIYSTNVVSDPNQILAVEYRVSDRLFFLAQYQQASTQTLTAHNNSFSFEIRFRKRF